VSVKSRNLLRLFARSVSYVVVALLRSYSRRCVWFSHRLLARAYYIPFRHHGFDSYVPRSVRAVGSVHVRLQLLQSPHLRRHPQESGARLFRIPVWIVHRHRIARTEPQPMAVIITQPHLVRGADVLLGGQQYIERLR
jgi:hypothetical protein